MVFQDKEGHILQSFPRIYNNLKGFDYLVREIQRHLGTEKDVHIGFEPTGHYWKNLIYYLEKRKGYKVHFVRTTAVKSQRELDESSPSKTDVQDANMIASLIREGKSIDSKIPKDVFKDLREISKSRAKAIEGKKSVLNRLRKELEIYFPEVFELFHLLGIFAVCFGIIGNLSIGAGST